MKTASWVGRFGALVIGLAGACLAAGAAVSILVGLPGAAHGLRPIHSVGEIFTRFRELAPVLSVAAAAVIAALVLTLQAGRRLRPVASAGELVVLGVLVILCVAGASGRIGYASDGRVLTAAVLAFAGGAAIVASGIVAALAESGAVDEGPAGGPR